MVLSALRRLLNRAPVTGRRPHRRSTTVLRLDHLEERAVPATLLVNDNWVDVNGGTLEVGDTVNSSLDAGVPLQTGAFGVTAFSNINDALAASSDGDTIQVLPGTYTGNVTVNTAVTLEGANAGVSAGTDAGTRVSESVIDGAVIVQADSVTIDGFTIQGGADIGGDVAGIFLAAGASDATIQNNIITGEGTGRGILSTFNGENDNLTIAGNNISNWTTGIFNQTNDGVEILNNVISDNVAGVANDYVNDVLIKGNTFTGNDEAVGVFMSTGVVVTLNNLADNGVAINNYGGDAVAVPLNYFGTTDPDEIAKLVEGDVEVTDPLASEVTATTRVYTFGDVTLQVDTATGAFTFTLADGTTYTGTGARVQNGKLKIHEQTGAGKIDVMGDVDGSVSVNLRGRNKQSFTLEASE